MGGRADWGALRARRMAEPGAQDAYEAARLALELGRSVRELREQHGWSQTELARQAGMTQSAVARFEAGGTVPTLPVHASGMPSFPATSAEDAINQPARVQFEVFLDEHRAALNSCLNDLTEGQVRRSMVPSRTTLLGLVKHATFVEKVWFDEAISCRSRVEIGIPATPDESFILDDGDAIAGIQRAHHEACEVSRRAASTHGLDDLLHGNRRGPLPLRWVYLHMLRELAQHCGHADILREQLLSEQRDT